MTDYDPVKRREYYLRTRELKGRKKSGNPSKAQEKFRAGERQFDPGVIVKPKNGKIPNKAEQTMIKNELKARLKKMVKTDADLQVAQKSLDDGLVEIKRNKASGKMSQDSYEFELMYLDLAQKALDEVTNERTKTRVGTN